MATPKKKNCVSCDKPSIGKCWGCGKPVFHDQTFYGFVIIEDDEDPNEKPMKYAHQACDRLIQEKVRQVAFEQEARKNGKRVIGKPALSER